MTAVVPSEIQAATGLRTPPASQRLVIGTCPLCGGTRPSPYVVHPEVTWVKCSCGLIFKQASGEVEAAAESAAFATHADFYSRRQRRRIAKSRAQIRDVLNHVAPGPLLDVGCSLGYTLKAARSLGLPPTGVEINAASAAHARSQGFDVETGTMDALPFADQAFQIVVMKHVLEHTPDPRSALREMHRVLKPGGGLFIAVPHAGYNKAVRNPQASRFYVPTILEGSHFIFYTPATLARLLETEGFSVRRIGPHLTHRTAPPAVLAAQFAAAPLRWVAQKVLDGFALRKEFWMVAVRR